MGKIVEFIRVLTESDQIRRSFTTEKGRVIDFVIQYETLIDEKWTPIVRYDTHHDFAHRDEMFPDGTQKKTDLGMTDWNEALTFAIEDTNKNWKTYKQRYLRRMKKP